MPSRTGSSSPAMMTVLAPASRAIMAVPSPIMPAPSTATDWPSATSPTSTARAPMPSGSVSAPSSMSTLSGKGMQLAAGAATWRAKPPGRVRPMMARRSHNSGWPAVQNRQLRQGTPGATVTRCPSNGVLTSGAADTIRPANSWPSVTGISGVIQS